MIPTPSPRQRRITRVSYCNMLARCSNPRLQSWKNYGGRGILVCDRWKSRFDDFVIDLGWRPSTKHCLDRIDPNGNYEPGNVRWGLRTEQTKNTRRSKTKTVVQINPPKGTVISQVDPPFGTVPVSMESVLV